MIIKSHKDLAKFVEGKKILHLNSLGKDSVLCLEWLVKSANPDRIVSVWFKPIVFHPDDERYLKYLKSRYPDVEFITEAYAHEISGVGRGIYQDPITITTKINKWEYESFDFDKCHENVLDELNLDFMCDGTSKYESVARAVGFHKRGIVHGRKIFPLGMMTKKNIYDLIKKTGVKLHPCYKIAKTTFDYPSYYKMRSAFILNPEYEKLMYSVYPLLILDKFRYERML